MPKTKRRYTRKIPVSIKARKFASGARKYAKNREIIGHLGTAGTTKEYRSNASSYFGAPSYTIQTGRLPFSRGGFFRLPYSESFALSADGSLGTAAVGYTYNLTSPYDPRIEIGGGQPIQWDQLTPAFERYQVWGAKVSITFSNPLNDGAFVGFRVRSSVNTTATSGKTIAELKETDLTRSKFINNSGRQVESFKFYIRPWHVYGITKQQYVNLEYTSIDNTIPAVSTIVEPFLLHTVFGETNTIRCTIRVVYYVQLMQGQTILDA